MLVRPISGSGTIREKPSAITRLATRRIDILIVFHGGSGTPMPIESLAAHAACNDPSDRDCPQSLSRPAAAAKLPLQVIYLHSDPVATSISLFRRRYAANQSGKLTRRLSAAPDPVGENESLEEFARRGEDRLGMTAQFQNWREIPLPYDVAFVHYETMWESLSQLFEFLELSPELVREFPPRIERHSADNVPAGRRQLLDAIYAPLRREMARRGDFHVSRGARGLARACAWLTLARRAVLPTLSWEASCRWPRLHGFLRWCCRRAALS